jgi:hypothetical protein
MVFCRLFGIPADLLVEVARAQRTELRPGDVPAVRTGWPPGQSGSSEVVTTRTSHSSNAAAGHPRSSTSRR